MTEVGRLYPESADGRVSVQVAVMRGDDVLVDVTLGAGRDARYCAFSLAKPVVAGVVARLIDRDLLAVDLPVAAVVPAFDRVSWRALTIEHLLLHTGGFPRAPIRPDEGADRARREQRFRQWYLEAAPGQTSAYHASSAHWVLADVLERITGTTMADLVRTEVTEPLGLPATTLGSGPDPRIQPVVVIGEPPSPQVVASLLERGLELDDVVGEASPQVCLRFNDPAVRRAAVPGAGLFTNARDVAHYLQTWLREDEWLTSLTRSDFLLVRNRLVDRVLGVSACRSLAFVHAGDDGAAGIRLFTSSLGPAAFGHAGAGGQAAWADPAAGLSCCVLTSGFHRNVLESTRRTHELSASVVAGVRDNQP